MWAIIKFDKRYSEIFKDSLKKETGNDLIIYSPKLLIEKYTKINLLKKILVCLRLFILFS